MRFAAIFVLAFGLLLGNTFGRGSERVDWAKIVAERDKEIARLQHADTPWGPCSCSAACVKLACESLWRRDQCERP